jgi:protein-S-isoprenylcysteine O-methyltransferase Ste14
MYLFQNLKMGIWNGWLFMVVFLIQMLAIALINKSVWERSQIPLKEKQNKFEQKVSIIGNVVWFLALVYSVFLPFKLDTIWFYSGAFVFFIGLILLTVATINFLITPLDKLITKGAYNLSRHPMYLASSFICIGTGIATMSFPFILLCLIMTICFYHEALIEERYCHNRYKNDYKVYVNNTPRWFGFLKKKY